MPDTLEVGVAKLKNGGQEAAIFWRASGCLGGFVLIPSDPGAPFETKVSKYSGP